MGRKKNFNILIHHSNAVEEFDEVELSEPPQIESTIHEYETEQIEMELCGDVPESEPIHDTQDTIPPTCQIEHPLTPENDKLRGDWDEEEPENVYVHESEDEQIGFVRQERVHCDNDGEDENDRLSNEEPVQSNERAKLGQGDDSDDPGFNGDDVDINYESVEEDQYSDKDWMGDEFDVNNEDVDKEFAVGDTFSNIQELRRRVKDYVLKVGFIMKKERNCNLRYTLYCKGKGCKWRLHASVLDDERTFMIKTYHGGHRCVRRTDYHEADYNWLASKIMVQLRDNPAMTAKHLES
ncbi:hypothetical protein OROMI_015553 [Orobanche minor]